MTTVFKFPKTLGAAADLLHTTRLARLTLQKDVDALQATETALSDHIIANLPKSDATGVAGKLVRVSVVSKTVVTVTDWDAIYAHIIKTQKKDPGVWALLQRRVGDAAVKEAWESGVKIPGTDRILVPKLSVNKL
jgi:hypothetical protein